MTALTSDQEYIDQSFKEFKFDEGQVNRSLFTDCRFYDCSFREVVFHECRFNNCRFEDCDLSLSRITGSHFRNTRFERCRLLGIDWTAAAWPRLQLTAPIGFRECVIDFSTFIGLKLPRINIRKCRAIDVAFTDADLTEADFSRTTLTKSRFDGANLTKANLEGASDYTIDLTSTIVRQARFSLPEAITLLYSLDIDLID